MLKFALLGILNYSAMNGYELKQFMDVSTGHFWYAKLSQIYMTLKTLEKEGLLTSEIQPPEDRLGRRVYTITEAGRTALRRWLQDPIINTEQTKEPLLLKVFFAAQLDKETLLTQLRLQRTLHQQSLDGLRTVTADRIHQSVDLHPALAKDALLWNAVRRAGELAEDVYLRWLDETIKLVEDQF